MQACCLWRLRTSGPAVTLLGQQQMLLGPARRAMRRAHLAGHLLQMVRLGPLRLQRQRPLRQHQLQQQQVRAILPQLQRRLRVVPLVRHLHLLLVRKEQTLLQQPRQQQQQQMQRHQQQRVRRVRGQQQLETLQAQGLQQQSQGILQEMMQVRVRLQQRRVRTPASRSLLPQPPSQQQLLLWSLQQQQQHLRQLPLRVRQPHPVASSPLSRLLSRQQGPVLPAASC